VPDPAGGASQPRDRSDPRRELAEEDFAAFVFRWKPGILAFLADKTDSAEDLEDAAALTFISAWQSLRKGWRPDDEWLWLTSLARRAVSDWYRWKKKSRGKRQIHFFPLNPDPEEVVSVLPFPTAELRESVREALSRLPKELRQVVQLRYLEGLTRQEVGERLGLAEWDVKARLRRARGLLREFLRRQGE